MRRSAMNGAIRATMAMIAGLLMTRSAPMSAAQEPSKPQAEHAFFQKFVGDWDCEIAMPGGAISPGTSSYRLELNGLHLVSDFVSEFGGFKFQGKGTTSYCPVRKKYLSTWVDSMTASPMTMEGSVSADQKTFTEMGEGPHQGKMTKYKSTTQLKDADTMVFTMSVVDGGTEAEMMTITYRRQKKK